MLEEDIAAQSDDSSDESTPEMDLLAELNKLHIDGEDHSNVNDEHEVIISKASSKILSKTNPVFDSRHRSSKVRLIRSNHRTADTIRIQPPMN